MCETPKGDQLCFRDLRVGAIHELPLPLDACRARGKGMDDPTSNDGRDKHVPPKWSLRDFLERLSRRGTLVVPGEREWIIRHRKTDLTSRSLRNGPSSVFRSRMGLARGRSAQRKRYKPTKRSTESFFTTFGGERRDFSIDGESRYSRRMVSSDALIFSFSR